MGLGQTLLTILSLMLMGRLILTINSTSFDTGFVKDMAEYSISATSLGTSMLEKAEAMAFDNKTANGGTIQNPTNLTAPGDLKAETADGEVATDESTFDDVDDYNGFTRNDTVGGATFTTFVAVEYDSVNAITKQVVKSSTQTFSKKITVKVTSPYLVNYAKDPPVQDTLRFEKMHSYWYYR